MTSIKYYPEHQAYDVNRDSYSIFAYGQHKVEVTVSYGSQILWVLFDKQHTHMCVE